MRIIIMSAKWLALILLATFLSTGCSNVESNPVMPATDRPTLLFFFTDD